MGIRASNWSGKENAAFLALDFVGLDKAQPNLLLIWVVKLVWGCTDPYAAKAKVKLLEKIFLTDKRHGSHGIVLLS